MINARISTKRQKEKETMKTFEVYEKTKYKAVSPTETIMRIKAILEKAGIKTEETWMDSGVTSICSVRITIAGTTIGQNGKGTSREYALASGYAEFMERLQTGYLLPERLSGMQDRTYMDKSEVEDAGGTLLYDTLRAIRREVCRFDFMPVDVADYIEKWSFDSENGTIAVIPYKTQDARQTYYIPENLLRAYYYTNGSCAGNSREEALVQGMSEICERFATLKILREKLTPPVIPEEVYCRIPGISKSISEINKMERFCLKVMDASCGLGLPVVAAALFDRQTARVVLRFGAHPKPEVAMERCVTEILQGKNIHNLELAPVFDCSFDSVCDDIVNRYNFLKGAFGAFPSFIYAENPSWEFETRPEVSDEIQGQLAYMQELYDRLNWNLYIRDCSFLGFPTYHLLVPGISMVFNFGMERLVEKRRLFQCREVLMNPKAASKEQLEELYKLALMKRGFVLENNYAFLAGIPVYPQLYGMELDASMVAGILAVYLGKKKEAISLLKPYCFDPEGKVTGFYPVVQLLQGENSAGVKGAMKNICPKELLDFAERLLENPLEVLPILPCPDCNCCREQEHCRCGYLTGNHVISRQI